MAGNRRRGRPRHAYRLNARTPHDYKRLATFIAARPGGDGCGLRVQDRCRVAATRLPFHLFELRQLATRVGRPASPRDDRRRQRAIPKLAQSFPNVLPDLHRYIGVHDDDAPPAPLPQQRGQDEEGGRTDARWPSAGPDSSTKTSPRCADRIDESGQGEQVVFSRTSQARGSRRTAGGSEMGRCHVRRYTNLGATIHLLQTRSITLLKRYPYHDEQEFRALYTSFDEAAEAKVFPASLFHATGALRAESVDVGVACWVREENPQANPRLRPYQDLPLNPRRQRGFGRSSPRRLISDAVRQAQSPPRNGPRQGNP